MSNDHDIVLGVTTLVGSLDALLKTDTVDALVSLAKNLGIQSMVVTAIDTLKGLLDKFVDGLEKLKSAFLVATRLPEILESMASLLDSVGDMVDSALKPTAIINLVQKAEDVTKTVIAALPKPEDMDNLKKSVGDVKATLLGYRNQLVPALPAGGTA